MKLGDALKYTKYANADHARKFAQHMVPHVVRPAQIIWNKALGGLFLVLAFMFASYAWKYYGLLKTPDANPVAFGFAVFMAAIMAVFGTTSLLRARRLSRL
ncbi:MAG: hypothetical protein JO061_16070 [Acidobacteriaceae bacterium]|nr:hypothetical protein [Acidobacteriaceae bacterium]